MSISINVVKDLQNGLVHYFSIQNLIVNVIIPQLQRDKGKNYKNTSILIERKASITNVMNCRWKFLSLYIARIKGKSRHLRKSHITYYTTLKMKLIRKKNGWNAYIGNKRASKFTIAKAAFSSLQSVLLISNIIKFLYIFFIVTLKTFNKILVLCISRCVSKQKRYLNIFFQFPTFLSKIYSDKRLDKF